jgi:hypothetical protein
VVLLIFWIISRQPATPPRAAQTPPASTAVENVTHVSPAVYDAVGDGGLANPLKPAGTAMVLRGSSGKPMVVYVGADFCPFCASQRWSVVAALARFGTFQDLRLSTSSSTDVYPDTATLSFHGSRYDSQYLEFSPVETRTRDGQPLDTPTALQEQLMRAHDPAGSIPFVDLGNRYVALGSGYRPGVLAGKGWDEIGAALKDPSSPISRAVIGNANYLTAAICQLTDQEPVSVCQSATIQRLQKQLPTA